MREIENKIAGRGYYRSTNITIVGIGASAGGLEALFALLPHLQPNGYMTYVIAQHMAHDGHSDLMLKLLARHSNMEVSLVVGDEMLLPNHIYLDS
jgi:chemotaxis response regulator CheB